LSGCAIALHLIRGGRVVFKPVIALDRYLAFSYIEDDVSKTTAVVLISKWHQRFEVFLQVRSVVLDWLVLAPRVVFAVIALHFFGCSIVTVTIEDGSWQFSPGKEGAEVPQTGTSAGWKETTGEIRRRKSGRRKEVVAI
jgi:hypothetical protein